MDPATNNQRTEMTKSESSPKSEFVLTDGLWRLYRHLSIRRRWQLCGLLGLSIVGSFAELGAIGAVLPFLALMADPSLASRYPMLQSSFAWLGWNENTNIFLPATVLFVSLAIGAASIRMLLTWAIYRVTFGLGADLGKEIYRRTLLQPYSYHVARNSSQTISSLNKVHTVVVSVVIPFVQSIVSVLFVLSIAIVLISVNPVVTCFTALTFTFIYSAVTLATRKRLRRNSQIIASMETARIQAVQEGLGGVRDVIIDGTQRLFVDRFWDCDSRQGRAQATNSFMSYAPRYMIESFGVVLIALLAYWLSQRTGGISGAIPILGALALGAQRALPQVQQVYLGWASLNGTKSTLEEVVTLLDLPIQDLKPVQGKGRLNLDQNIHLQDVSFRYSDTGPEVVRNVNITLGRGERIGFVGKTGSGKSTLVDLIMGLLEPTSGTIYVDGQPLTQRNRRHWQATISHVPQAIYLSDATIAENIAFGQRRESIDLERVRQSAAKARIAEFIEQLPLNYKTVAGERGVRLSGGQRQRIGLARALYKRADVIVLDEATSALDSETEAAVMDAIYSIGRDVTVLIIAHRLSTLRTCDRIFELSDGIVGRESTYADIDK